MKEMQDHSAFRRLSRTLIVPIVLVFFVVASICASIVYFLQFYNIIVINDVQKFTTVVLLGISIYVVVCIVCVLFFYILLRKVIYTPLQRVQSMLNAIADEKSYIYTTNVESQDISFGIFDNTFRDSTMNLISLAQTLRRQVHNLKKFHLTVENSFNGVLIADAQGKILYANSALEKITGFQRVDLAGESTRLWNGCIDKKMYPDVWNCIAVKKNIYSSEHQFVKKNGNKYTAEVYITPILDEKGNVLYFASIQRDITKQKEVDRAKTEFVSLASHQLRTPLSSIRWHGEMMSLLPAVKKSKKQKKYVKEIQAATNRMASLINTILNVSRLELGKLIIEPKPTDLVALLEELVQSFHPQCKEARIQIKTEIAKGIPPVIPLDPDLVHVVMQNILSNSIKYSPAGSVVHIRLKKTRDSIKFEVSDTGYGIPKKDQEHVFTKLYRAENIRMKVTYGNGLGLYIVKMIMDEMKGDVSFVSKEHKGTTFTVTIPIKGVRKKSGEKKLEKALPVF